MTGSRDSLAGVDSLTAAIAALIGAAGRRRVPRGAWRTSTGASDRAAEPAAPALAARRTAGHLRLGAALPALDRAVPQGRPQIGVYLQVTGAVTEDLAVPGRPYTFGELQAAQAAGDRQALAGRDDPCCGCT